MRDRELPFLSPAGRFKWIGVGGSGERRCDALRSLCPASARMALHGKEAKGESDW